MHLLNIETFSLETFFNETVCPPYAILSHTWGEDNEEVSFRDIEEGKYQTAETRPIKLEGCCTQAKRDGYTYIWIDTCCIDKTNSVELQEAINSMFRWYKKASICYAYLSDVPADDNLWDPRSNFFSSRWFMRGWTLQELLAPQNVRFYSSEWHWLGTKGNLCTLVEKITHIPHQFLLGIAELHDASVAQRMSWAAKRVTKRREDIAYCLLGIFSVTMPMIYGEGDNAFRRLQECIMKEIRDDSILAWGLNLTQPTFNQVSEVMSQGILAASPSDFTNCGQIVVRDQSTTATNSMDIFGSSLRLYVVIYTTSTGETFGLLKCGPEHNTYQVVGIPLTATTSGELSNEYVRPPGRYCILISNTTAKVSANFIQIQIEHQYKTLKGTNHSHWFHIQESVETKLQLIDVAPRSCWHKERSLIEMTSEPDGDNIQQTLARLRHKGEESHDFVLVLELKRSQVHARCCLMIFSRDTPLENLAQKFRYMRNEAFRWQRASNGILNLHITLEPVPALSMFTIRQDIIPNPPKVTFDADLELRQLDLNLEIKSVLEDEDQIGLEEENLIQKVQDKSAGLEQMKKALKVASDELSRLEKETRLLAKRLDDRNQEIDQLNIRRDVIKQRKLETQGRLDELLDNKISARAGHENGCKSEVENDHTMLNWAAARGYEGIVRILLEKGSKLKKKVKLLLEQGDDLDSRDRTPLSQAAGRGHEAVVKLLLEHGAELEASDVNYGWTPLWWATRGGHKAVVKLLLENGAELEAKDTSGKTPLSWAAEGGHEAVVKLLLENGAELEAKDSRYDRTPLSWAARGGHEAVVKLLLENGAKLEATDNSGWTPLPWAAQGGHEAVVKLLLEKGAELEPKDNDYGGTPLWWAANRGHEAVVKLLIQKGAELDAKDSKYDRTPLSWAARGGHEAVVKLLLENGAKLEATDYSGRTPLWWAAQGGHEAVAKLLLEHGAELEAKDRSGRTPLSWAAEKGHEAVVKLLLERGAKKS